MLYPIELLRHKVAREDRGTMDGEHVNGQACFCHVVLQLFKCRQEPQAQSAPLVVQIASARNAIIAICNDEHHQNRLNPLLLKDLMDARLLACRLL